MLHTPEDFQPLLLFPGQKPARRLVFHASRLLLRKRDLALPSDVYCAPLQYAGAAHAVGLWRDVAYEVQLAASPLLPDDEHAWFGLRALFGAVDDGLLGLASRAVQLAEWARTHRYCGVCATPMAQATGERAYRCPACGFTAYPRISPAMMVLIRQGDAVLLARHAQSPYQRFTALAGFLEAGESVEEAVHREVYEEVGLRVHQLKYFGSQSWPFPHSLMIAFTAEYLDGEIRVDQTEIAEARWFGPGDDFPEVPPGVSIASALINAHRHS
jgi:NAD+ diphosphatase